MTHSQTRNEELAKAMERASDVPENMPNEADIFNVLDLQKVRGDKKATFRSDLQWQAAWVLRERKHHLILVSPPGSGKTLPVQMTTSRWAGTGKCTILVEPYALLYEQMKERMKQAGLKATIVERSNTIPEDANVVIVGINYFRNSGFTNWMKNLAGRNKLGIVAFDEVHTVAEDDSFRPIYKQAMKSVMELPNVNMVWMTGTAPVGHMGEIWEKLDLFPTQIEAFRTLRAPWIHRENMRYQILYSKKSWTKDRLMELVRTLRMRLGPSECAVMFFNSKSYCQTFADDLGCEAITGDTPTDERAEIYARWKDNQLLCMNKAGYYGADMPGVALVLHIEAPDALTDYLQGTGRGGRDGTECLSIVLAPTNPKRQGREQKPRFSGCEEMTKLYEIDMLCILLVQGEFFDGKALTCAELEAIGVHVLWCERCARKSGDQRRMKGYFYSEWLFLGRKKMARTDRK